MANFFGPTGVKTCSIRRMGDLNLVCWVETDGNDEVMDGNACVDGKNSGALALSLTLDKGLLLVLGKHLGIGSKRLKLHAHH